MCLLMLARTVPINPDTAALPAWFWPCDLGQTAIACLPVCLPLATFQVLALPARWLIARMAAVRLLLVPPRLAEQDFQPLRDFQQCEPASPWGRCRKRKKSYVKPQTGLNLVSKADRPESSGFGGTRLEQRICL